MTIEFAELGLHPTLVQAVAELGYTNPTPIQSAMIPVMLTGRDVIGQAQTGTGKTAAFALPMLHNLDPDVNQVQGLVVTPTRELALQVARAVHEYGRQRGVRVLAVYGGQPYDRQIRRLMRGIDIVVGTPGRLLDLIRREVLDLSAVRTAVLDEADEMLSMGFIEDIQAILDETPESRQTALFSATLPAEIRRLADRYLRDPHAVTIGAEKLAVQTIEQRYYLVNEADKLAALTRLFEVEPISSALIFARTRLATGSLANELTLRGFPAEALNGDMSQDARESVLNRFRQNQIKVLVATDVAARGLDIDDISHVFNFDLPHDPEWYVHRVGRTGRAGKTGIAITLLTPKERWRLRRIEGMMKQAITAASLPTADEILKLRETQLVEQMLVWLRRNRCLREREIVNELAEQGYDLAEVAAAALKMARAEEKQRPIAPLGELQELGDRRDGRGNRRESRNSDRPVSGNGWTGQESDSHERGMVRLSLNAGRVNGVRVNQVVSALARSADIPGGVIGKIKIHDQVTLVDVPQEYVGQVLAKTGAYRFGKQLATVQVA